MEDHAQNRKVPFSDICKPTPREQIPLGASHSDTLAAELFRAAGQGDLTLVKELCKKNDLEIGDVEHVLEGAQSASQYRHHAFSAATQYSQLAILEYLHNIGAQPTFEDLRCVSLTTNNVEVLEFFIQCGVDLDLKGESDLTCFRYAASNEAMFNIWHSQGADPNGGAKDIRGFNKCSCTPLETVLGDGRFDLAEKLIQRGADPKLGQPLSAAIQRCLCAPEDLPRVCEWASRLIEAGCDINKMFGDEIMYGPGRPLHYAAQIEDSEPLIELLINHGANPTARSSWNETPWDWAVKANKSSRRKKKLLLGARGEHLGSPAACAHMYAKMDFLPLSGFDEREYVRRFVDKEPETGNRGDEDEGNEVDSDDAESDEVNRAVEASPTGGIWSRLSKLFGRGSDSR